MNVSLPHFSHENMLICASNNFLFNRSKMASVKRELEAGG